MRNSSFKRLKQQLKKFFNDEAMNHYQNNQAYDTKFEQHTHGSFGTCPTNPIQLSGNHRVDNYLQQLQHVDASNLRFKFVGYTNAPNLNLQTETFQVVDDLDEIIDVLYICTGAVFDSEECPAGFYLKTSSLAA